MEGRGPPGHPTALPAPSAWQEISSCALSANTPAIHFLQGSEGAPDLTKLFTNPRPSPRETLSLMFSLLQEINMLGGRQTRRPLPGGLSPFSGPPPGALTADVHKRINKRSFSRVNTGHNQTSGGSTVLRMISAAHMWINTSPLPPRPESQVCLLPGSEARRRKIDLVRGLERTTARYTRLLE